LFLLTLTHNLVIQLDAGHF